MEFVAQPAPLAPATLAPTLAIVPVMAVIEALLTVVSLIALAAAGLIIVGLALLAIPVLAVLAFVRPKPQGARKGWRAIPA